jgi:hypothetical protein
LTPPKTKTLKGNIAALDEVVVDDDLELTIEKSPEEAKPATEKSEEIPLEKERFTLIYEGFKGLEIHNFAEKAEQEISLMPLFQALNACIPWVGKDEVEKAYDYIYDNANLTSNARRYWEKTKDRNEGKKSVYGLLIKYIKQYNDNYYKETLKIKKNFMNSNYTVDDFKENPMNTKTGIYIFITSPSAVQW